MKKTRRTAAFLLACAVVLSACGSKSGPDASGGGEPAKEPAAATEAGSEPQSGGGAEAKKDAGERKLKDSLTAVVVAEPGNLDPTLSSVAVNRQVEHQIFNTLLRQGNDGEILPELATKWEQIDDLTIRFYLRDDAVFHNGKPMTAEDVKFTLWRVATTGPNTSMFKAFDVDNTAVVDDHTVDIKLKYEFAPIFNYLASPYAAIHCKSYVEEVGDDRVCREPVGTGPFRFKSWKAGESIELERYEDYWGDKPSYSRLTFKFITEPANRTIELETGGADIIYDVSPSDLDRLNENPDTVLVKGPGRRFTYITLNMKDPIFADPRVREACSVALDMEAIVDAVYGDMATVADSIMNPKIVGYKSMGVIPYDPEKARALLDEAGVDTLNLTFKMNDNRQFIDVAEIAQNMWKEVGINAEVKILEMATFTEQGARGEVQVGMSSYSTGSGDPDQALQTWKSDFGGQIQGCDPKIDELLLAARKEYDLEKRKECYAKALDYMWNTHYMIPVAFNDVAYATRSNVENLECHIGELPDLSKVVIYEE